jgi:hypothetical protein
MMYTRSMPPLIEEIETAWLPHELFAVFKDQPYPFFLDSGMDHQKLGRYSLMGSRPFLLFKSRGSECTIMRNEQEVYKKGFNLFVPYMRRNRRSPLAVIKSANYLENLLARREAR